jgi:hypothetical protein
MSESCPGDAHDQAAAALSAPERNGPVDAPAPATNGTAAPAGSPAVNARVQQAEVLADRLAERVAHVTASLGRGLFRLAARAREEAEDIWAEAQNIRRGDKS